MTPQAPYPDPDGWTRDNEAAPKPKVKPKPKFQITLTPAGSCGEAEAIRRLRALLKASGRRYGFRCLSARELKEEPKP